MNLMCNNRSSFLLWGIREKDKFVVKQGNGVEQNGTWDEVMRSRVDLKVQLLQFCMENRGLQIGYHQKISCLYYKIHKLGAVYFMCISYYLTSNKYTNLTINIRNLPFEVYTVHRIFDAITFIVIFHWYWDYFTAFNRKRVLL